MSRNPPKKTDIMHDSESAANEFSRIYSIESNRVFDAQAGVSEIEIEIEAEADDCKALAVRFGLISLDHLSARGSLDIFAPGCGANLDVLVKADIVQTCVATLEPIVSHIEERLVIRFEPGDEGEDGLRPGAEILVDVDDQENTEKMPENEIDVGEAVAECLGLAIDPYPRSRDADKTLEEIKSGAWRQDRISPFAELEKLKRK